MHGLASNARMWDGVALRLAAAGHGVAAVDLRGHGRSEQTTGGHDTSTAAADLAALVAALGWTGPRAPVVAGQSWGGNVVLELAARHGGVAAVAFVDGGWIRLADRFADEDELWAALAPPRFDGAAWADVEARIRGWTSGWPATGVDGALANLVERPDGTARARLPREHHREILTSLWSGDPRPLYPQVAVPALLLVAGSGAPDAAGKRRAVGEAAAALPDAEVRWYAGAAHDLHAEQPERTAADLQTLAARAERVG